MLQIAWADFAFSEPVLSLLEIAPEIERAIAVKPRIHHLDLIQDFADLWRGTRRVRQEIDESLEGALKVDVIFPEGIVGIDQQIGHRVG